MTDFAAIMPAVAAELLGEPNSMLSKPPHDVRYGNHVAVGRSGKRPVLRS
jgi:hypothetical protein